MSVNKVAEKNIVDFANSEEKRSAEMFKFRETLPAARAAFESAHKDKYRDVCEFFEFQTRFGRSPLEEDKATISLMGEELTRLAGRLYHEKAFAEGVLPKHSDITKLAYKEFDLRPQIEKSLADQMMVEHRLSSDAAQTMTKLMLSQEDMSGQKLNKTDEAACLNLTKFAETRIKELAHETGNDTTTAKNQTTDSSSKTHQAPDLSTSLTNYRLTRELTQMQSHAHRHGGILPSGENLTKIQEQAKIEIQKMAEKIQLEDVTRLQRDAVIRQNNMRL